MACGTSTWGSRPDMAHLKVRTACRARRVHVRADARGERSTERTERNGFSRGRASVPGTGVATGAATPRPFRWLRNRIVPVGSSIVVIEPLDRGVADELMTTRRMTSDSRNSLHHFLITPDDRFVMSNPQSDLKSGRIGRKGVVSVFPQRWRRRAASPLRTN